MDKQNKSNFSIKNIPLIIAAIGLLAPAGYIIGVSYYQGVLTAYGVSPDSFPITAHDVYVAAYYAIGLLLLEITRIIGYVFKLVITPPGVYWLVAGLLALILFVYMLIKRLSLPRSTKSECILKVVRKLLAYLHWDNNAFSKAVGVTSLLSYGVFTILSVLMMLAILWFFIPMAAHYEGRDVTRKTIDIYLEKGCVVKENEIWSNCKTLLSKDNKAIYTGILVAHSSDYLAFFTEKGSFVLKIPSGAVIVNGLRGEKHNE
ncbi:MAG: hypothetical protein ABW168_07225 [Sedimenticola sp.]